MRSEEIAPLLSQTSALDDVGIHIGKILAWDPQTGNNTVSVLGSELHDLPTLNLTETLTLSSGDVVSIFRVKFTMFILGRVTIPGSSQFFSGAMPAITTAFYPMNTTSENQTNSFTGSYFAKQISGHVVNHPRALFGVNVVTSGCTGAFKVAWFTAPPTTGADPPGATIMAQETGIPNPANQNFEYEYRWPAGMRGQLVYVVYLPSKSSGVNGDGNWVSAMPRFFYGAND